MLLAIGIDANGNTLILAWAIVESKNKESWWYFFEHLRELILEISEEMYILTFDRDKGITAVEKELGQYIVRIIYY